MMPASMTTFAFVFPGPGFAVGRHARRLGRPPRGARSTLERGVRRARRGPGRADRARARRNELDLTTNTQPVMLTAGIACYRAWVAEAGAQPAIVAGHRSASTAALVAAGALDARRRACRSCAFARRRCRRRCRSAPARWRRSSASTPTRCAQLCAEAAAQRRGRRGGRISTTPTPDRDRRREGRRREGLRDRQGQGREARAAAAGVGAVPLDPDEARRRPAARAPRAAIPLAAPQIPLVNNVDVAVESEPAAIRDALYRQAFGPGALGRGACRRCARAA